MDKESYIAPPRPQDKKGKKDFVSKQEPSERRTDLGKRDLIYIKVIHK